MSETTVRTYQAEDLETLCDIATAAWRPYFETLLERMGEDLFAAAFGDWQAEKTRQVRDFCRKQPERCLVTELDGAVVGFITYWIEENRWLGVIGNNAVDPEAQGHGIGTEQYRRVLAALKEDGISCVKVTTGLDPFHAPARRGYEKVGFKPMVEMVDYYQTI